MRILLTGGTGSVGKAVIHRLLEEGHEALVIGRREDVDVAGAEYRRCDVTDFPSLLEVSKGFEAIIHLAAVANPFADTFDELFRINCAGTYNLYEAATKNGISRVVSASSINAFGFNFGTNPFRIAYFPVDEETPGETSDVYSLSKEMTEEIAAYHFRRNGLTGACIRIPWVYPSDDRTIETLVDQMRRSRDAIESVRETPVDDWSTTIESLYSDFDLFRVERYQRDDRETAFSDRTFRVHPLFNGLETFWTVIDERDSAQAFVKAATADYDGMHVLFANDSHNRAGIDTNELVELMFPVPGRWTGIWKRTPHGTESLVSIEKARKLIGFEPEYLLARFFDSTG